MRLFEAVIDANHRAVAGDASASVHPGDFADELPVIALTCIDPRLNAYFPGALGLPAEQFIWLRNAGNIIFDPMSSMTRTLALACAVKGGREIAIIGHTDCLIGKTTTMQLLDRFKELGIERHLLPDNLNDFFGIFSSERQNVIKSCDIVRHSPLIGPKVPVHGFLMDVETGRLEWIVNGYQSLETAAVSAKEPSKLADHVIGKLHDFKIGEMKFPEAKIGEMAAKAEDWMKQKALKVEQALPGTPEQKAAIVNKVVEAAEKHWPKPPSVPPKITVPPPIRSHQNWRRPNQ
jgi:carbonic anhydrase